MFGPGAYFADCPSKAASYCSVAKDSRSQHGLLLLCKVALGEQKILHKADYTLPGTLENKYQSVKAHGAFKPSNKIKFNGSIMPCGKQEGRVFNKINTIGIYVKLVHEHP